MKFLKDLILFALVVVIVIAVILFLFVPREMM